MYRMYRLTHNPEHLRMAHLFDKPRFYLPLVRWGLGRVSRVQG